MSPSQALSACHPPSLLLPGSSLQPGPGGLPSPAALSDSLQLLCHQGSKGCHSCKGIELATSALAPNHACWRPNSPHQRMQASLKGVPGAGCMKGKGPGCTGMDPCPLDPLAGQRGAMHTPHANATQSEGNPMGGTACHSPQPLRPKARCTCGPQTMGRRNEEWKRLPLKAATGWLGLSFEPLAQGSPWSGFLRSFKGNQHIKRAPASEGIAQRLHSLLLLISHPENMAAWHPGEPGSERGGPWLSRGSPAPAGLRGGVSNGTLGKEKEKEVAFCH